MASIKFILKTQKADKSGKSPLYIRLIKNRKTSLIYTGLKIEKHFWDDNAQKVRRTYSNSVRINALLADKFSEYSTNILKEEHKARQVSAANLKISLLGQDSIDFFEYAAKFLVTKRPHISENTFQVYTRQINKFKMFVNLDFLPLEDLKVPLIRDYIQYCSTIKNNKMSSIKNSLIPLSSVMTAALNDGLIKKDDVPFGKIKIKTVAAKKNYLSKEQIETLQSFPLEAHSKLDLYRNLFLFSVSAGGLRFSDTVTLRRKNVNMETGILERRIGKSARIHRLKMGPIAISILKKYWREDLDEEQFIFPAISTEDFDKASPVRKRVLIISRNVSCGNFLKNIEEKMKLPFHLHFHMSRHTFATQALSNGMRLEYVSKLMDHSNISTTQLYAKIIDTDLDDAVDQFVL